MKKTLFIFLCSFILSAYTWQWGGIQSGGPGRQMTAVDVDTVYGCADIDLPYLTVDGGETWNVKAAGGIRKYGCYGLIRTDNANLYLGIIKVDNWSYSYDPIVYRSQDGGNVWTIVAESIWPETYSKLDWMVSRFPWSSDSNSVIWMSGYGNKNDVTPNKVPFGKISASTFTDLGTGIPSGVQTIWDVDVVDKTGTQLVLISKDDGVYYCNPTSSCDATGDWTLATGVSAGNLRFMYVDPSNDDIVYLVKRGTTGSDIYKSTNRGVTWAKWNASCNECAGISDDIPTQIAVNTNGVVCVTEYRPESNDTGGHPVYCSSDGATWTEAAMSIANCVQNECNNMNDGTPWLQGRDLISAGTDFWVSGEFGFWRSTDGGAIFTSQTSGYYDLPAIDVDCAGGNCWTADYDYATHKSTSSPDGPWAGFYLGPGTTQYECGGVDAIDANTVYYACAGVEASAGSLLVFKTTDGGLNWTLVSSNLGASGTGKILATWPRIAVSPVDTNKILVGARKDRSGASGGIWYSSNAGASFTKVLTVDKCGRPAFDSSGNAYNICNGDIYKALSTNLASWSIVYNSAYFVAGNFLGVMVDPNNNNNVWAVTDNNKILKSENAGTSWTAKYTATDAKMLNGVVLVDRTDATGNTVYASWNHDWEFGYSGGLIKTIDGGTNWVSYMDGLIWAPEGVGFGLYQDPSNDIFATATVGIYKLVTGSPPPPPPPSNKLAYCTQTATPPTIDGAIADSVWTAATAYDIDATMCVVGTCDSGTAGQFKCLFDSSNIYIAWDIDDDSVQAPTSHPSGNMHKWDSVEIYFDRNNEAATSYDANDWQLGVDSRADPNTDRRKAKNGTAVDDPAWLLGSSNTGNGWDANAGWIGEASATWADLGGSGVSPAINDIIGLDFAINDSDTGGTRESQEEWSGDGTSYLNPSQFGQLKFIAGAPPSGPCN